MLPRLANAAVVVLLVAELVKVVHDLLLLVWVHGKGVEGGQMIKVNVAPPHLVPTRTVWHGK